MNPKALRRSGLQGNLPFGSLERSDYVLAMSDGEFGRWCAKRLAAAGSTAATARVRQEIATDEKLRAWAHEERRQREADEGRAKYLNQGASESALEQRMLEAFLSTRFFERVRVPSDVVVAHGPLGMLLQQLSVSSKSNRWRLDFAIMDAAADVFVCVEVDGHQFHEKTPEQAQRDHERDRRLTSAGWLVLRYTGREVARSPGACVAEVIALAMRLRKKVGT